MSQVLTDLPAQALSFLLACGLLVLHTWALEASLRTHHLSVKQMPSNPPFARLSFLQHLPDGQRSGTSGIWLPLIHLLIILSQFDNMGNWAFILPGE